MRKNFFSDLSCTHGRTCVYGRYASGRVHIFPTTCLEIAVYCGVIIYYCITYPENSAAQQLEEEGKSLFCVQEILQSSKKERKLALLNNSIQTEQSKYESITRQRHTHCTW